MIDKLSYDQVLAISKELKNQAEIVDSLIKLKNVNLSQQLKVIPNF